MRRIDIISTNETNLTNGYLLYKLDKLDELSKIQYSLDNALSIQSVMMEDLGIGAMDDILVGDTDDTHGHGIL
jgi:hypothetical protein